MDVGRRGGLAQLVAHLHGMQGVRSSSLLSSTRFLKARARRAFSLLAHSGVTPQSASKPKRRAEPETCPSRQSAAHASAGCRDDRFRRGHVGSAAPDRRLHESSRPQQSNGGLYAGRPAVHRLRSDRARHHRTRRRSQLNRRISWLRSYPSSGTLGSRRTPGRRGARASRNVRAPSGRVQDNVLSGQLEGKCHRNIPPSRGLRLGSA